MLENTSWSPWFAVTHLATISTVKRLILTEMNSSLLGPKGVGTSLDPPLRPQASCAYPLRSCASYITHTFYLLSCNWQLYSPLCLYAYRQVYADNPDNQFLHRLYPRILLNLALTHSLQDGPHLDAPRWFALFFPNDRAQGPTLTPH